MAKWRLLFKRRWRNSMKKGKPFKSNWELIKALLMLIIVNKKWYLLPLLIILALLGLFITLTGNHSVLPAIYALF